MSETEEDQKQTILVCKCGKLWNGDCAHKSLSFGNMYIIKTSKLCLGDAGFNREYVMDPNNGIRVDPNDHKPIRKLIRK